MFVFKKPIIEKIADDFAKDQNNTFKLNRGQVLEAISIILNSYIYRVMLATITLTEQGNPMPAKKKSAKKAKPASKPYPKK